MWMFKTNIWTCDMAGKNMPYIPSLLLMIIILACSTVNADQLEITGTITENDFLSITDERGGVEDDEVEENTYEYQTFSSIEVNSTLDAEFEINITIDKKIKECAQIKTYSTATAKKLYSMEMKGKTLFIESDFPIKTPVHIEINTAAIESVNLVGKNKVRIIGVSCEKFTGYVSGKTQLEITGRSGIAYFDIKGEARLNAKKFKTDTMIIYGKGNSQATVNPIKGMKAVSYENATIKYVNQPEKIIKKIISFGMITYEPITSGT